MSVVVCNTPRHNVTHQRAAHSRTVLLQHWPCLAVASCQFLWHPSVHLYGLFSNPNRACGAHSLWLTAWKHADATWPAYISVRVLWGQQNCHCFLSPQAHKSWGSKTEYNRPIGSNIRVAMLMVLNYFNISTLSAVPLCDRWASCQYSGYPLLMILHPVPSGLTWRKKLSRSLDLVHGTL